jgi:hypothetical protein
MYLREYVAAQMTFRVWQRLDRDIVGVSRGLRGYRSGRRHGPSCHNP